MKHKIRKAVWSDPVSSKRGIVTQDIREYSGEDEETEKIIRRGNDMSKAMPKHSLGHKDLGWIFIKASSIERQKTFDVECASIAHLTENCTFEAAMAILEQLREKIYVDFDRTPPATRQDLKDSNA